GGGFDTGTNQVFPDGTSGDWSTVNTVNVANHCPNAAFIARLNTEVFTVGGSDIRARALATCEQQIPKVGLCSPGSQVIGTPGTSNDGVILQENSGQGSEGHAAGFVFTGMAPGPWQVEAQVQSSDGTGSDGVEWRTFTVDVYR